MTQDQQRGVFQVKEQLIKTKENKGKQIKPKKGNKHIQTNKNTYKNKKQTKLRTAKNHKQKQRQKQTRSKNNI